MANQFTTDVFIKKSKNGQVTIVDGQILEGRKSQALLYIFQIQNRL